MPPKKTAPAKVRPAPRPARADAAAQHNAVRTALQQSYKGAKGKAPEGYVKDAALSGKRSQVYVQAVAPPKVIVTHTGTKTKHDLLTDAALAAGLLGKTKRAKHSDRVTKAAVAKYGGSEVTVAGHSLGGALAERQGSIKGVKRVVTVNKGGALVRDPFSHRRRASVEQTDFRHALDPISLAAGGALGSKTNWGRTRAPHSIGAAMPRMRTLG